MPSNIVQLRKEGLTAYKCGDFGALFESLTAEERAAARLPQWRTVVWVNGVAVKGLYRGQTAAYILEQIAREIDGDETAADVPVDRIAVSIERVVR